MGQANRTDPNKRHDPGGSKPQHSWLLLLVGCSLMLVGQAAVAGDGSSVSEVGAPPAVKPTVNGNLVAPVRRQLSLAFHLAQERIRTRPTCSTLFSRLGADGVELLARLRYDEAGFEKSGDGCGPGVPAHTKIGTQLIKLCPSFGVLPLPEAAVNVIHEALHSAGMSEKPADPNGLTPKEINRLVAASCGL